MAPPADSPRAPRTPRADDYDALAFDCYGTLIDWGAGIVGFLQPALLARDAHVVDDFLLEFFAETEPVAQVDGRKYGDVLREVLRRLGGRLGFTPPAELLDAFAASPGEWAPFADTAESLQRLAERFRLAIVSNIDNDLFANTAKHLGMTFARDTAARLLITAEDVGAYKPDRRVFDAARAALGQDTRILHVAQSLYHDIAPASALGWDTVWIRRASNAAKPAEANPTWMFDTLAELADALLGPAEK